MLERLMTDQRRPVVAVLVALRMDTASMQPIAILLESLSAQHPRNGINDPWIKGHVAGWKVCACGWLPFPYKLAGFE